jgi:ATP-dependent 26S proteasome regulatory subunit
VTIIELSGDSLRLISTACSVAPDFAAGHDRHRGLGPDRRGRPGRVDQAVALELPDADARRALFGLYRGGLVVDESRLETVLERTEGVTASFLKELLRRAALLAAEETDDERLAVSAGQLDAALDELLDTRNAMTRTLLGA